MPTTKRKKKQVSGKQLELSYHKRCRAVAKALGGHLHGSSFEGGFAFTQSKVMTEVSHDLFLRLEKLVHTDKLFNAAMEALTIERETEKVTCPAYPSNCSCECHDKHNYAKGM